MVTDTYHRRAKAGRVAGKAALFKLLAVMLLLPVTFACASVEGKQGKHDEAAVEGKHSEAAVEGKHGETETQSVPCAETPEEQVDCLEQELQGSLIQFDKLVEGNQSAGSGSSSSAGAGTEGTAKASPSLEGSDPVQIPLPDASAQAEGDIRGRAGTHTETDAQRSAGTETADTMEGAPRQGIANSNSPRIPADIPPGTDDDVVAGQLREAAEASGSEELWNEYRRYKGLPTQ